jgi:uncharacterized membrane protein
VGEFLPTGTSTFRVVGPVDGTPDAAPDPGELLGALSLGRERRHEQDVGFGLRQLVDVACRALSPGINDPTTAVQVLDQLHELVRRLAVRPLPGRQVAVRHGRVVAAVPVPRFCDYLDLAVDEIHHWGHGDPRIRRRLRRLLVEVHGAARPEHRVAIARKLAAWEEPPIPAAGDDLPASDIGLRAERQLTGGSRG